MRSALVDLGGGDTSLQKLLATLPTLASDMASAGVTPVAVYALGLRVDDLASFASFEVLGFRPEATVLVRNEGLADAMIDREDAFARVMRHSAYRALAGAWRRAQPRQVVGPRHARPQAGLRVAPVPGPAATRRI